MCLLCLQWSSLKFLIYLFYCFTFVTYSCNRSREFNAFILSQRKGLLLFLPGYLHTTMKRLSTYNVSVMLCKPRLRACLLQSEKHLRSKKVYALRNITTEQDQLTCVCDTSFIMKQSRAHPSCLVIFCII